MVREPLGMVIVGWPSHHCRGKWTLLVTHPSNNCPIQSTFEAHRFLRAQGGHT
jgi:hypothetical protein